METKMKKYLITLIYAFSSIIWAQPIPTDDSAINDAYIDKALHSLIYGADCNESELAEQRALPKGAINANDKSTIDTAKYADAKSKAIAFNGVVLKGGIFDSTQKDSTQNLYLSPDRKISYAINDNTLEVKAICQKQGFTLTNFANGDFGINLSHNPTKEVAIALNVNKSMSRYTDALIDIAPFLAKHILGDTQNEFAKISLVTFSYIRVQDLGSFYDAPSFTNALYGAKGIDSKDNLVNIALVESMRNFTKDNGLKKEIYLITNGASDDPHKEEQMLAMTKNLNANIVKNSKENFDNRVKIHIFALKPFQSLKTQKANTEFLQNLAKITGGTYNEANNVYDFKKQILTLSNDGKPFDMRELDNKIRPSKNHKIYDPNNPNDNPPKNKKK